MQAVLKRILERATERSEGDDWRPSIDTLRSAWPGLVGEQLAEVTTPKSIDWDAGRLVVATDSENWRRELQRRERQFLSRIDDILPWRLRSLRFEAAAPSASERTEARESNAPDSEPDNERPAPGSTTSDPEDRTQTTDRVDVPDDLESALDSLEDETAAAARRIFGHLDPDSET